MKMRRPFIRATSITLFLICLMYAITYIDRVNVSTASLAFKKELHLSNVQVGLIFSAFAYPYLVLTVFGGWLSDKMGARRALTWASLTWATATLWSGVTFGFASLLCSRLLLGVGEGATFPIATRAMCDWVPKRKRAFSQGITHASSRLGAALTPPLVAWLVSAYSWRSSFLILGGVSLGWALVWWVWFRDEPQNHPLMTDEELDDLQQTSEGPSVVVAVPWCALTRRMMPVIIVYFCYGWTLWLYLAWIPSYFVHNYGLDIKKSAIFSAGVFLAGVLGDTAGGVVSDFIFRHTGSSNRARRDVVLAAFLCSMTAMVMIFFVHSVSGASICLSIAFFFAEFTIGPMWSLPMDIAPEFAGSASGLMNTGSPLAAILSPIIFGYITEKTGNWNLPFIGSIGVLLLGSAVTLWIKPEEPFVVSAENRVQASSRAQR
jgi:sugar phosphate permease